MSRWIYLLFSYAVIVEIVPAVQLDLYRTGIAQTPGTIAVGCVVGLLAFRLLSYFKSRSITAPKDFRLFFFFCGCLIVAVFLVVPWISWIADLTGLAVLHVVPSWRGALLYIDFVRFGLYAIVALVVAMCEWPFVWPVVPINAQGYPAKPNSRLGADAQARRST
jgi:hypothetical protein